MKVYIFDVKFDIPTKRTLKDMIDIIGLLNNIMEKYYIEYYIEIKDNIKEGDFLKTSIRDGSQYFITKENGILYCIPTKYEGDAFKGEVFEFMHKKGYEDLSSFIEYYEIIDPKSDKDSYLNEPLGFVFDTNKYEITTKDGIYKKKEFMLCSNKHSGDEVKGKIKIKNIKTGLIYNLNGYYYN